MHNLNVSDRLFDTLIVGAGSMGMAAGYYLSRIGNKVLLLDAGDPPHAHGAHHGSTRLIRHAYGESAGYVPLALRAQQLWRELEEDAGTSIFARTGVANIGSPDDPFLKEVQRSATQHGLSLESLDGSEASKRWPAWRLTEEQTVCFEPDAGVLYCEQAIRSFRDLAISLGATLRANTLVTRIELHGESGVSVVTDKGERFTGGDLIVCAGKWTRPLLEPLGLGIPVTRLRKTFAWFESAQNAFAPEIFPGFAVASDIGLYYGFPDMDGSGLKVGRHDGGEPVAVDAELGSFGDEPADLSDLQAFLRRYLPGAGKLRMGRTCEYDVTPDAHFIIDRLPACPRVQIATGFSGHGFKFSSAIGEALAERVTQSASRMDLSLFACERFNGTGR
jgi:N-methyl-L-tryptophan oxidase